MARTSTSSARLEVAARTAASVLGGYLLAHLVAVATRSLTPLPPQDAARLGAMLAFTIFGCAVVWCFGVRRQSLVWAGVLLPSALLGLSLWIFGEAAI